MRFKEQLRDMVQSMEEHNTQWMEVNFDIEEIRNILALLDAVEEMRHSDFDPYGNRVGWQKVEEMYVRLVGESDE